ncbi:MAG: hypothetical protein IPK00_14080 [Deltaproteobacteria bacterium]|nr:hypothetical protein [Deltaproteobacteria bacterium]
MIDRITGQSLLALLPSIVVIALAAGPSPSSAVDQSGQSGQSPAASGPALTLDDATLEKIAPALPQIINLAILDPWIASEMVPDSWLDSAIESARLVAQEKPRARPGRMEPATWPVGPWSSAAGMAASIRDLDPNAAAALFGALRPRLARRCEVNGATAARCEQEMRVTLERLGSPVVAARLAGRDADPITDSQLEFARLGPQVVHPGRAKIAALRRAVWP